MTASCDSCESSCKATKLGSSSSVPPSKQMRMTYEQWRARRLLDVQFLLFFIFTHIMYGFKTSQQLNDRPSDPAAAAYSSIVSRLDVPEPTCSSDGSRSVSSWLLQMPLLHQLLLHVSNSLKVLLSPWLVSATLRDDGIFTSCVAIMPLLLLLLTPTTQQYYLQHPTGAVRVALLLMLRFAKLSGAVASIGLVSEQHLSLVLLGYFLTVGQYMYSGWQAAMTLVPAKVQLAAGLVEWLMICYIISAVKATHPAAAAAITTHSTATLCSCSFLIVYVAPSLVSLIMERRHRRQYAEYLAGLPVAAAAGSSGAVSGHDGGLDDSNDDGNLRRRAAVSLVAEAGRHSSRRSRSSTTTTTAAATVLGSVFPGLASLVGYDRAQQLITDCSKGDACYTYDGFCTATNMSVKVYDEQHQVSALGPLLHMNLTQTLDPAAGSSSSSHGPALAMHSVCFRGCVQLLAVVYGLRRRITGSNQGDASSSSSDDMGTYPWVGNAAAAAKGLLLRLQKQLACAATSNAAAAAVDVIWGNCCVSCGTGSDIKQQQQQQQQQPQAISREESVQALMDAPAVQMYFHQPCLLSDQPTSLEINLSGLSPDNQAAASSSGSSSTNRLLVFQQQRVLVNTMVDLKPTLKVQVPPVAPGVLHVVLLPVATAGDEQQQQQQLGAPISQPLLVLSAAAAAELQQLHDAAAATVQDGQQQLLWQGMFAGLSADVAYLLGSSSSSSVKFASSSMHNRQLAPEQAEVLKHVLVYLAQNKCWETMKFVVEAVAAAVAAAAAAGEDRQSNLALDTAEAPASMEDIPVDQCIDSSGGMSEQHNERHTAAPSIRNSTATDQA